AQDLLADHELAVVFTKRSGRHPVAWIGQISALGPFPNIAEHLAGPPIRARSGRQGPQRTRGKRVSGRRNAHCRNLPFEFGWKSIARPARESVRLIIAHMRDWSRTIDRPHTFKRHREPLPVALLPIERSSPGFPIDDRPAVGKAEREGSIAAVLDECEPFRIGDKAVGETERMEQLAVARRLIVPRETVAGVTYLMDPAGILDPAKRLRLTLIRARAWRQVGRPQRIC